MTYLYESALGVVPVFVLVGLAVVAAVRGRRTFTRGLREPDHPEQALRVIRGIRSGIVSASFLFIAGGIYFERAWPIIFGLVVLGEELLETGVMILALRRQRCSEKEGG